jgi:hypothetical protein
VGIVSGGLHLQTASATGTTDANTFLGSHTFDLARPAVVTCTFTTTSLTGDGETYGTGAGQIGVGFASPALSGPGEGNAVSLDGVLYTGTVNLLSDQLSVIGSTGYAVSVGQFELNVFATPRYLRLGVAIFDNDSGLVYAGANHPRATVRYDISYL